MVGCAGASEGEVSHVETTPTSDVQPASETPRVRIGSTSGETVDVHVELAIRQEEKERGLMYRRYLAPDAGMLFVYDSMEERTFWMVNTFVSLDMVFIDDRPRVVGIVANATPLTRESRGVDAPSQYVLEVGAGFCQRHGIEPGDRVRFFGVPTVTGDGP
jgi:uncharacterized membrane protein (UPF0127 family)